MEPRISCRVPLERFHLIAKKYNPLDLEHFFQLILEFNVSRQLLYCQALWPDFIATQGKRKRNSSTTALSAENGDVYSLSRAKVGR